MTAGKPSPTSLIAPSVPWLSSEAKEGDTVLGCRLEVARNLADIPFPRTATERQLRKSAESLRKRLHEKMPGASMLIGGRNSNGHLFRLLNERWLADAADASVEQAESSLWLSPKQDLAMAINYEEHLLVRACIPGLDLEAAWSRAERAVADLTHQLPVAFLPDIGYLTSCTERAGAGLKISVLSHLPALVLSRRIEAVLRASAALGVGARGAFVRKKQVSGHYFQFTWQSQGRQNPAETLTAANSMLLQLVRGERAARTWLWREKRDWLYDYAGRAYGILRFCRQLSEHEMFGLLSGTRLGCCFGLFSRMTPVDVDSLLVSLRDAHLAAENNQVDATPADLDRLRSLKLRRFLSERLQQPL